MGQQRLMQNAQHGRAEMQQQGSKHLAVAIGAYRGSPIKKITWAVLVSGLVMGAVGVALQVMGIGIGGALIPGFMISFICIFVLAFVPPYASQGAVREEAAWGERLGFPLYGYFELLAGQPEWSCTVAFEIRFLDPMRQPDPGLLMNVLGALDPDGNVEPWNAGSVRFRSGSVSGATGIRINNVPVYRNHKLPAYVHTIVDGALLTLHRSYPLASVSVRRF